MSFNLSMNPRKLEFTPDSSYWEKEEAWCLPEEDSSFQKGISHNTAGQTTLMGRQLSQKVSDEQDQLDSDCLDVGIVAPSLNFNLTEDLEDVQKRVTEWISLSLFSVWPH